MHLSEEVVAPEVIIIPYTYLDIAAVHRSYQRYGYEEGVVPIWGERIRNSSRLGQLSAIMAHPLGDGVGVGRATESTIGR